MTVYLLRAFCFFASFLFLPPVAAAPNIDTLIINGQVHQAPDDTVVGVTRGKISYLGTLEKIQPLLGDTTQVIDLEGAALYPGFIELHAHVFDNIMFSHRICPLQRLGNSLAIANCVAMAEQWPKERWVMGYSHGLLDTLPKNSHPRQWLDKHFPDRPVVVSEPHSLIAWLNTRALERLKVTRYSLDAKGGRVLRDSQHYPNGIVVGAIAEQALMEAVQSHPMTFASSLTSMQEIQTAFHQQGITSLAEGGSLWQVGSIDFWLAVLDSGQLDVRVSVRPRLSPYRGVNEQLVQLKSILRNDFASSLIINQVKISVDGQYHLGTARLNSPYLSPAIASEEKGLFYFSPTELNTWLQRLQALGYGAYLITEGDAAVEAAVYSIQNARRMSQDQRFTLTDMHFVEPNVLQLIHKYDVSVNFTELHDRRYLSRQMAKELPGSVSEKVTLASLSRHGISTALSSKGYNGGHQSPLAQISQSLQLGEHGFGSVSEAIDSYTIEPARALGIEGITGSIVLGKSADFVVMERTLDEFAHEAIADAVILMTLYQGKVVYEAEELKQSL
ncbi:amidohydrolase [Photobacterium sanctipauli]|uniref:amidohydrolase n=1 Tax=Photobacterium sanctipauli TaxID=1342794 RepID=UPI0020A63B2E|nr:amidohydrolase family protein [Photobacterium sanctipauli]